MNLTQEQIIQLLGQKELDNYALRVQIQQLQQEVQSLKDQIKELEESNNE